MGSFIHDMIHMTEGEKIIHYWWLWLILVVFAFSILRVLDKRK